MSLSILSCWVGQAGSPGQWVFFAVEGAVLCAWSAGVGHKLAKATESERWHRRLTETAADGVWVTDEDGVITYANPRMGEILGVPASKLTGRRTEDFLFPEEVPVERIRFGNRREGFRQQFDRRLRRQDGSETWVLVSASSLPLAAGLFQGTLAMMTEITERKSAELALRRSEERFRNLFENAPEGVYQSTPEGRILAANPTLLRMLGLNNDADLSDVNIARDLYADPDVRAHLIERLELEGTIRNVEYSLRRSDGRVIRVLENARAVRGDDGKVLFYEGTLTERFR